MLAGIAIIPSAPVLVPALAGGAVELAELRDAVLAAAGSLPARWIAVGAGTTDATFGPESAGTFAGFGVDLRVGLSPRAGAPAELPLCALITGWVREQARPEAGAQVRVYGPGTPVAAGRQLRAQIDAAREPIGVLAVADGANTLSEAAPGGYHPLDIEVQRALDDALAGGDPEGLAELPEAIVGRSAFAVLAGLAGPGRRRATEFYRGAPYGVGYFAGVWAP